MTTDELYEKMNTHALRHSSSWAASAMPYRRRRLAERMARDGVETDEQFLAALAEAEREDQLAGVRTVHKNMTTKINRDPLSVGSDEEGAGSKGGPLSIGAIRRWLKRTCPAGVNPDDYQRLARALSKQHFGSEVGLACALAEMLKSRALRLAVKGVR